MNIKQIIKEEIDKMSAIDLQGYYNKHSNNKEWLQILSKFPVELQREIIDERGDGTKDDIEDFKNYYLNGNKPTIINTMDVLRTTLANDKTLLGRLPQEVVDVINKKWGTQGKTETVYDPNPQRYFQYAKMSPTTAKPSIMFDGMIGWGVGRFIAALIRGDKTIKVWDLRTK